MAKKKPKGGARIYKKSGLFGSVTVLQAGENSANSRDGKSDADSNDHWYKKPVGIIVLSVSAGFIVLLLGAALRHFFPALFGQ